LKYDTAGVREYWVVDPDKQHIMVYNFVCDLVEEYSLTDKIKLEYLKILQLIYRCVILRNIIFFNFFLLYVKYSNKTK